MSSSLLSFRLGSTNGADAAWQSEYSWDPAFQTVLREFNKPVYHVSIDIDHDVTYNRKGQRTPVIDTVTFFVWTVEKDQPVMYTFEQHRSFKNPITLKETIATNFSRYVEDEDDVSQEILASI